MMNIHTVAAGGGSVLAFEGGRLLRRAAVRGLAARSCVLPERRPADGHRRAGAARPHPAGEFPGDLRPARRPAARRGHRAAALRVRSRRRCRLRRRSGIERARRGFPRCRGRIHGARDPSRLGARRPRSGRIRALLLRRRGAAARLPRRGLARHRGDPDPSARRRPLRLGHRPGRPPPRCGARASSGRSLQDTHAALDDAVRGTGRAARRGDAGAGRRSRGGARAPLRWRSARPAPRRRSRSARAARGGARVFRAEFARRFGFAAPDGSAAGRDAAGRGRRRRRARRSHPVRRCAPAAAERRVRAWFDGWREVPLRRADRARAGASRVAGPALIVEPNSTTVVEPGWSAERLDDGTLRLCASGSRGRPRPSMREPPIRRSSSSSITGSCRWPSKWAPCCRRPRCRSTSASASTSPAPCSTPAGALIANAPHMPVHLGSMGASVRAVIAANAGEMRRGRAWMLNAPYAGGTHLPDITVVSPVFVGDEADARILRRLARAPRRHRRHHARLDATRLAHDRRGRRAVRQLPAAGRWRDPRAGAARAPRHRRPGLRAIPRRMSRTSRRSSPRMRAASPNSRR